MNNHFFLVHIRNNEEIHKFIVKKADSMQSAANSAMRRARSKGLDSPILIDVQEKLLTSPQSEIPS